MDASEKLPKEWFLQADYDMDTAQYMFDGGRYFYCIFMCHLSIEKALKGLYRSKVKSDPPKIHNLLYLAQKVQLTLPPAVQEVVFLLNRVSVPTRYPEELRSMSGLYGQRKTETILTESRRVVAWLKTQLPE